MKILIAYDIIDYIPIFNSDCFGIQEQKDKTCIIGMFDNLVPVEFLYLLIDKQDMKSKDKKRLLLLVALFISFMFFKWGWHAGKEDRQHEQSYKVMSK